MRCKKHTLKSGPFFQDRIRGLWERDSNPENQALYRVCFVAKHKLVGFFLLDQFIPSFSHYFGQHGFLKIYPGFNYVGYTQFLLQLESEHFLPIFNTRFLAPCTNNPVLLTGMFCFNTLASAPGLTMQVTDGIYYSRF